MIYIGVDIGDGDTAVAACYWEYGQKKVEALKLDGMGYAMPTLLSRNRATGRALVGKNAMFSSTGDSQSELYVNFKYAPEKMEKGKLEEFSSQVVDFINTLFRQCKCLETFWTMDESEYTFCFGHPTTWSEKDVDLYMAIIREADVFKNTDAFFGRSGVHVRLIPCKESHAALLNLVERRIGAMQQTGADGTNQGAEITQLLPDGGYLITIDWGSSTTDITTIENSNGNIRILPGGEAGDGKLGARYLDRAIVDSVMARMDPGMRGQLETFLAANPHYWANLIFTSRLAKEAYFNATQFERDSGSLLVYGRDYYPIQTIFPRSSKEIMNEVVDAAVKEFSGHSWRDACRNLLVQVKASCQSKGKIPEVIYLTGGASRMDFIGEMSREEFPGTKVMVDPFPSVCIAQGLALMPYKLDKANEFMAAVSAFTKTELPSIVRRKMSTLSERIARGLTPGVCSVARRKAHDWRNREILTLNGLESRIQSGVEEYLRTMEAADRISSAVGGFCSEELMPEINGRFEAICREHHMVSRSLSCASGSVAVGCDSNFGDGISNGVVNGVLGKSLEVLALPMEAVLVAIKAAVVTVVISAVLTIVALISIPIASAVCAAILSTIAGVVAAAGIFAGPLVLAIVVAVGGWAIVKSGSLKSALRSADLPRWVRQNVVSYSKLDSIVSNQEYTIKSKIASGISGSSTFQKQVQTSICESLERQYERNAQDLALRIYG